MGGGIYGWLPRALWDVISGYFGIYLLMNILKRPNFLPFFLLKPLTYQPRFLHLPSHTTKMPNNQPHILIIGGSYGGLGALNTLIGLSSGQSSAPDADSNIARGLRSKPRYTLLDERDGFYHTVGAPLGQISLAWGREFWVPFEEILRAKIRNGEENIRFEQGTVRELDMRAKRVGYVKAKGEEGRIEYDYMVLATGMKRKAPVVPQMLDREGYLKEVAGIEEELKRCRKVVLVGGGKLLSTILTCVFPG